VVRAQPPEAAHGLALELLLRDVGAEAVEARVVPLELLAATPDAVAERVADLVPLAPRELAGTDGAAAPFWSPDSQSLAFLANTGRNPQMQVFVARGSGAGVPRQPGSGSEPSARTRASKASSSAPSDTTRAASRGLLW